MAKTKKSSATKHLLPVLVERAVRRIHWVRGQRVMFDSDLAVLYEVPTKALNQAVSRNIRRFPADFMFQLTGGELDNWRSQIVTSNPAAIMGLRRPPYAFTELGVAMLSSVLNSERAMQMNIVIMRAFVKIRELLATNRALAQRIEQLSATVKDHARLFDVVLEDIRNLDKSFSKRIRRLDAPPRRKPKMGFYTGK